MPRSYGVTNVAPWATAPPVGPAGDTYYNTGNKALYISDGTQWNQIQAGGGGGTGGAPYAPVQTTPPPAGSPTISPPVGLLWVDTSTSSATNATNLIYYQTLTAPVAGSPVTVTHNLGSIYIQVQLWDVVTGLLVGAQVKIIDANNVQVSVTQSMPNNVNVVVVGITSPGPPVNAPDYATKLYVDQRTPNLPAPVTSGSGVQSYTDTLGDVWVAANGVNGGNWKRARDVLHARWYRNAAWQVTGSIASIGFDTPNRDPYGLYATGTTLYTAPIAGLYSLYAGYAVAAPATVGSFTNLMIRYGAAGTVVPNGTRIVQEQATSAGTQTGTYIAAQVTWAPNAGDVFWIEAYSTSGGLPYTGQPGSAMTFSGMDYLGTG
jgi:hypothetical protein